MQSYNSHTKTISTLVEKFLQPVVGKTTFLHPGHKIFSLPPPETPKITSNQYLAGYHRCCLPLHKHPPCIWSERYGILLVSQALNSFPPQTFWLPSADLSTTWITSPITPFKFPPNHKHQILPGTTSPPSLTLTKTSSCLHFPRYYPDLTKHSHPHNLAQRLLTLRATTATISWNASH